MGMSMKQLSRMSPEDIQRQGAINGLKEAIKAEITRGGEVNFRNLFRISVKLRKGHPVKEVNTGKAHPAKDYMTPVCYFSKNVKDAVKNTNR